MHRQLISDAGKATSLTGRVIFMRALQEARGMTSASINQTAIENFEQFDRSGHAPAYVQNWCLDKLRTKHKPKKATRMVKEPQASLVGALVDRDDDTA